MCACVFGGYEVLKDMKSTYEKCEKIILREKALLSLGGK